MPRSVPESRLKDLLACATRVFIANGYRRSQMSDVAQAAGLAKGTVYLYVESKEALFAAALRYADGSPPASSELDLPIPTPAPGELAGEVLSRLSAEAVPDRLARALERKRVTDVCGELDGIVRELFALSSRHRTALKLLDRCASDHPDLRAAIYDRGRFAQLAELARYLDSRIARGRLRPVPDLALAARFIIEVIATWAVHIHWDPAPQPVDPELAEETVAQLVVDAFVEKRP